MRERERRESQKEIIGKGELFFLKHPGTMNTFSGYGLTSKSERKDLLVGILMVDRPLPVDPDWLQKVDDTYGECQLVAMTSKGERGLACQMQIEDDSVPYLRKYPSELSNEIQIALNPMMEKPPAPVFNMQWDEETRLWRSEFAYPNELPTEIREVFEKSGYGCLAAETDKGIVHVCHASDRDIEGFADKPVRYQWQLIKMPTAPLIRLDMVIIDQSESPFKFESFLNVAAEDQAQVLADLANQDQLYLAFYGDDLEHRFTKIIDHDEQQWQQLDELVEKAEDYLVKIPQEKRDFDRAKWEFMMRFV